MDVTAKENGLNLYQYLMCIFEELPNVDASNENAIDQLLPWSNRLPTRGLFDAYFEKRSTKKYA
ncbi:transposase domain-containing protein [Halalkalibacterium ligniniphilum]|uniref:transposase domain-containing protein n=1 Tax=Halalkalibacterium ligniniphilum TaxID=1134413 RepID=UPI0012677D72|nr:transposase domain-containing protein [Halalkalibacterium ligniniphilum]